MATASSSKSTATSAANSAASANLRIGLDHKQRGNLAFTSGDIPSALAAYHHAVLFLSGLESRSILGLVGENSGREGKPEELSSDDDDDEAEPPNMGQRGEKELSLVYSNMSACYLKQQRYDRAVQTADKALKCNSKNVKAKFRKCQALRLAGEVYRARATGREAVEGLDGKEEKESFERELRLVEKLIEEKEEQGRMKWKGVLTGNGPKAGLFGGKAREGVDDEAAGGAPEGKLM